MKYLFILLIGIVLNMGFKELMHVDLDELNPYLSLLELSIEKQK
jgi:hypothetical protein